MLDQITMTDINKTNTKQQIFFDDDPVMGTYPEYANRKMRLIELFHSHNADIIYFISNDGVENRENYRRAIEFIKENQDYQIYTIGYVNGWSGTQFADRGIHIVNSAYKYFVVKDKNYRVMRYDF